jgi:hypothetical protein
VAGLNGPPLRARKDQGEIPLPVMAIERSRSGEIPGPRKNAYFVRQGIGFQALGERVMGKLITGRRHVVPQRRGDHRAK